jgi:hypothetical protein
MTGQYNEVIKEATKLGYMDAPVGDFLEALSHNNKTTGAKWLDNANRAASYLSTKSEQHAREISFLSAYDLFKNAGGNGHRISMAAANDMANRVIGDFRIGGKADVFKGVVGTPLGLFQTFAINYFQNMYKDIENKQIKALMTRLSTQGFVFGGSSLPGYDFFNEVMFANYDGTKSPEQIIKGAESKGFSDLLLYGTLSNLPKMLGGDGIALNTRGEMQLPKMLTPMQLGQTPVASMATRTLSLISDGLGTLAQTGEIGIDQLRESAVNAIGVSRPIKGALEIAMGYSTNANHDVINDNTRDTMSIIARLAGLKTTSEAEQAKQMSIERTAKLARQAKMNRLSDAVVGAIRNNNLDGERLAGVIEQYISVHGSDSGIKQWFKRAHLKATVSKFDRQMLEAIKKNPRGAEALRFLQVDDGSY